eukprot:8602981-Alexandrium_andersonii.AAC.1
MFQAIAIKSTNTAWDPFIATCHECSPRSDQGPSVAVRLNPQSARPKMQNYVKLSVTIDPRTA